MDILEASALMKAGHERKMVHTCSPRSTPASMWKISLGNASNETEIRNLKISTDFLKILFSGHYFDLHFTFILVLSDNTDKTILCHNHIDQDEGSSCSLFK